MVAVTFQGPGSPKDHESRPLEPSLYQSLAEKRRVSVPHARLICTQRIACSFRSSIPSHSVPGPSVPFTALVLHTEYILVHSMGLSTGRGLWHIECARAFCPLSPSARRVPIQSLSGLGFTWKSNTTTFLFKFIVW